MRNLVVVIAIVALAACSKKKDTPKEEPAVPKPTEVGSGSPAPQPTPPTPTPAPPTPAPPTPAPPTPAVALAEGFSWTPSEDAFSLINDTQNPVAWGDAQVGFAFGKVEKKEVPVQIVVVTGGKAEVKKTIKIAAPGESGSLTLAPFGKDKFFVQLDLSYADAEGNRDFLAAVLSKTDKGITLDQSGTWDEVPAEFEGDKKTDAPKWATEARTAVETK